MNFIDRSVMWVQLEEMIEENNNLSKENLPEPERSLVPRLKLKNALLAIVNLHTEPINQVNLLGPSLQPN